MTEGYDKTTVEFARSVCHTDILPFDKEIVRNMIDWDAKPIIRTSALIAETDEIQPIMGRVEAGPKTVTFSTRADDPAILLEGHADFCTILLTSDSHGDAVMIHSPFVPPSDIEEPLSFSDEADTEMLEYKEAVNDIIDPLQCMTIITGMFGASAHNIDEVERAVPEYLENSGSPFLVLAASSILDTLGVEEVDGLVFIPRKLTTDGRNKIFLFDTAPGKPRLKDFVEVFSRAGILGKDSD